MNRWVLFLAALCLVAGVLGCGGGEEGEVAESGGGRGESDSTIQYPPLKPYFGAQGSLLDSLRAMKKRFGITRDEYWREEGGVLANLYFEVWYPAGRLTVTHGMYVFEALMPAREKLERFFGEAPRELLVIRMTRNFDEYTKVTGREWWYYSVIKADSMTLSPVDILVKRGIARIAIPHEYYQWAIGKITVHGAPRWLEEGVASYLSDEGDILVSQFKEFVPGDVSMSPDRVELALQGEEDRASSRIAYYRSYRMIKKLIDDYGEDKVKEAIVSIGRGRTLDEAFTTALGKNYDAILEEASDYTLDPTEKKGQ